MKMCYFFGFYDTVVFVSLLKIMWFFLFVVVLSMYSLLKLILYSEFCVPFLKEDPLYGISFGPHRI